MLCLCPNCHALFDRGALFIATDGKTLVSTITGEKTEIFLHERHELDLKAIAHHRLYVAGIRETTRKPTS
jgi:predicted restriction endonuclease